MRIYPPIDPKELRRCPYFRDSLYTSLCSWGCVQCPQEGYIFLVDISKVQDDEVGDGTTSVVVLACELLKVKGRRVFGLHYLRGGMRV